MTVIICCAAGVLRVNVRAEIVDVRLLLAELHGLTIEIPMLAPMFRIRLKMLVALPMRSLGIGLLVIVVSGTKTNPSAAPWIISGHTEALRVATFRLNRDSSHIAYADATSPIAEQLAVVELAGQASHDRHDEKRRQAAWQVCDAGMGRGVAEQHLHEQRQQDRAAVQHKADHASSGMCRLRYERYLKTVRSSTGCSAVSSRMIRPTMPDDRQHGQGDDEVRAKPVVFLTLVEHDLQAADADGQQTNAPDSRCPSFCAAAGKADRR